MKNILTALLLLIPVAVGAGGPPYQTGNSAIDENFRVIFEEMSNHKHAEDGTSRLENVLPAIDSKYDLGASGREWKTLYVDQIYVSSVTLNGLQFGGLPAGAMIMWGAAAAPAGWVLADGSSLSTTTYSRLFAIYAYTFGGSGGNFNVPDFRGVFPKGAGTTNRAAGVDASGNAYAATLGAYSTDKMQGHKHANPGSDYYVTGAGGLQAGGAFGATAVNTGVPSSDGTNGTPRVGHTTEPQNLGVTFIIYAGL